MFKKGVYKKDVDFWGIYPKVFKRFFALFSKKNLPYSILFFVVFLALVLYVYPRECSDADCFSDALNSCSRTKFISTEKGNIVHYNINKGITNCRLTVKMVDVDRFTASKLVRDLEGKSMKCIIPKKALQSVTFKNFEDILKYCTGSLKVGMYEVILERMYVLIARDLGNITLKMEDIFAEEESIFLETEGEILTEESLTEESLTEESLTGEESEGEI